MEKQLRLFEPSKIKIDRIYYALLPIHQKINYKANECGAHSIFLSGFNYFRRSLYQPCTDLLTEKYRWHHKVNAGVESRLEANKRTLF